MCRGDIPQGERKELNANHLKERESRETSLPPGLGNSLLLRYKEDEVEVHKSDDGELLSLQETLKRKSINQQSPLEL
jgi:hypothetical protein